MKSKLSSDGYPIASHAALDGKIIVHEVDLTGVQVPVNARYHGTATASLVVRDDLHVPQQPLEQKVVVVPVLTANGASTVESTPSDKLPIKMIYRAIVSLVSGLDGASAAFPNVVLVNHSICDEYAPSVKRSSQWGFSLNIAIRTLTLGKNGSGVYGVGGGMVLDSKAGLKWNECQWKSRVLGNVSSEGWREANHCKLACVTH